MSKPKLATAREIKDLKKLGMRLLNDLEEEADRDEGTEMAEQFIGAANGIGQHCNPVIDEETGETLLHRAAKCARIEVCRVLVLNRADILAQMEGAKGHFMTPCDVAANKVVKKAMVEANNEVNTSAPTPRLMEQIEEERSKRRVARREIHGEPGIDAKVESLQASLIETNKQTAEMVHGLKDDQEKRHTEIKSLMEQMKTTHLLTMPRPNDKVISGDAATDLTEEDEPPPRLCEAGCIQM